MIRTFLDSGILIAAARLVDPGAERALKLLDDPDRVFLTSPFVQLEVVPKAVFFKKLARRVPDRCGRLAVEWSHHGRTEHSKTAHRGRVRTDSRSARRPLRIAPW